MNPFRPKTVPRVPVTENPDQTAHTDRDYNTILYTIEPWRVNVICRYCGTRETDAVSKTSDRALWLIWLHQKLVHNSSEPKPTYQLIKKKMPKLSLFGLHCTPKCCSRVWSLLEWVIHAYILQCYHMIPMYR